MNHTLPQTLQIAVFLLYLDAVFTGLAFLRTSYLPFLLVTAAQVAGGYGTANEKKWGYYLGVVVAFVPFAFRAWYYGIGDVLSTDPISLMFEIALVALFLHPQSREHVRIWFR